jgi:hypothetical protein
MRTIALMLLALAAAPAVALAGDGKTLTGCGCANECPLAQAANERRSTGGEAVLASAKIRAEAVRVVVANLATI